VLKLLELASSNGATLTRELLRVRAGAQCLLSVSRPAGAALPSAVWRPQSGPTSAVSGRYPLL